MRSDGRSAGGVGFAILYSLVSLVAFASMAFAFSRAHAGAAYRWSAGDAGWVVGNLLMWAGSILFVGSLRRNPALYAPGRPVERIGPATGVFAITRHPMMWGFAAWSVTHALVAPTTANLVLSSAIAFLALGVPRA